MPSTAVTSPIDPHRQPDWRRFFPDADHRWTMGLRRGDVAEIFRPGESVVAAQAERARWLDADPQAYAALTVDVTSELAETVELARTMGNSVDSTLTPWDQLLSLGRLWEADFVWLVADEQGTHRVAGGVVCFPSSWALQEKLGLTLDETHHPVPGLNATLGRQIETFLDRMAPGEAWLRENAGYSRTGERNQHPVRSRRPLDATVTLDEVWVRLEHQLLLKLPLSRSLLFSIRVEVIPLLRMLESPAAAAGLLRQLSTMSPAAAAYKGLTAARDAIVALVRRATETSPSTRPAGPP